MPGGSLIGSRPLGLAPALSSGLASGFASGRGFPSSRPQVLRHPLPTQKNVNVPSHTIPAEQDTMRGYSDRPLTEPEFARRLGSATVLFARRARSRRRPVGWLACGRGSVGRASPCQGEGRGFESRRPLGDAEHRRGQPAVLGIHGEPAGCGLIGRRPGSFHGGVAEWFRQGPAKPCTRVRFPSPPPIPERHLTVGQCSPTHPGAPPSLPARPRGSPRRPGPRTGRRPAKEDREDPRRRLRSRPPSCSATSSSAASSSAASSSGRRPGPLNRASSEHCCTLTATVTARKPDVHSACSVACADRKMACRGSSPRLQQMARMASSCRQDVFSRSFCPAPCHLAGKMQQHYSGPVSRYILCISTASGK